MNFPDALQHKQTTFYKGILFSIGLIITSILFFIPNTSHSQQQINWLHYPDSQGFAYIQYTGEKEISSQELLTLIENQGCTLRVLWIKEQRIGYHTEAIGIADFVNQRFNDSTIQTNTKITLHCTEYKEKKEETNQEEETNEKTEQTQSFNLTETHIHWITDPQPDIQRNKQGQATIQYGGGSFYQLVSRLSTQGCNVHTLSIYNQEKKQTYTYSFENTNEQNKEFTNNYKQHIPKDTNITITCVDNCTIIYGLDLVEDERDKRWAMSREKCIDVNTDNARFDSSENIVSESLCGDNWSDKAREFFFYVPIFQDTCKIDVIVRTFIFGGAAFSGILLDQKAMYQVYFPSLYIAQHKDISQQRTDMRLLKTEFHELCHIHQYWYIFKEYIDYNYLKDTASVDEKVWIHKLWIQTPMAQEFNEIVGFAQRGDGTWKLRSDNPYDNTVAYGYLTSKPKELSAEICAYYLLQKIQPNSIYKKHSQSPYITEEIEQWIEKYIVLPE